MWLILNTFGARGIAQSRKGLIIIIMRGGASCDHDGLGVATQRVLEQTGELGITIWDVLALAVH